MNKITVVVGMLLVLVSAGFFYVYVTLPDEPESIVYLDESFTFVDSDGEELVISYDQSSEFASVSFKGNEYELEQTVSGSGTRYTSNNGLVVFTEHQGEASLAVGGDLVVVAQLAGEQLAEADIAIEDVTDLDSVERNEIPVADVPVLGQRCIDSETVDCAALEAAASAM